MSVGICRLGFSCSLLCLCVVDIVYLCLDLCSVLGVIVLVSLDSNFAWF